MGAGASRGKNITTETSSETAVANVNKPEFSSSSSPRTEHVQDISSKNNNTSLNVNVPNVRVANPVVTNATTEVKRDQTAENNDNKNKKRSIIKIKNKVKPNIDDLEFQDDESDLEYDIDEMLKIPVAIKDSKLNQKEVKRNTKEKNKNSKKPLSDGTDKNVNQQKDIKDNDDVPLPETYAQRLQRQQYKQQNLLRLDSDNRKNQNDLKEDSEDETIAQSPEPAGFDATKFRAVNRRGETMRHIGSQAAAPTVQHHFQTTEIDFEDFGVQAKNSSLDSRQLPQYDKSELELMKELEDEIL